MVSGTLQPPVKMAEYGIYPSSFRLMHPPAVKNAMNDLDRIRYRQADRVRHRSQFGAVGTQAQLGQVYSAGAFPTVGQRFALMRPAIITGDETEGATPTFSVESSASIPTYFYGTKPPTVGHYHLAHFVSHRWTAKSGRGCIGDANHICACNCLNAIPKIFYIGDSNGTHTLTYLGTPTSVGWVSPDFNLPNQDAYQRVFTNCFGPSIITLPYRYRILLFCTTMKWVLRIEFPIVPCPNSPGPDIYRYSSTSPPTYGVGASSEIDVDCNDFSMLSFTLPTYVPDIAIPGGGGPLTAIP